MKAFIYLVTLITVWPFAIVWLAAICTAFTFNPQDVFQSGSFWGISTVFWFMALMLIGPLHELMEEHLSSKKPSKV
jgi:hypothetical protein